MNDNDITNFEKLAAKTKEQLLVGKYTSMQWLHLAVDASADQLEKAGEFSKEEGKRASQFLKHDLTTTRGDFVRAREIVSRRTDPSSGGGGFIDFASHLFGGMGDIFKSWVTKWKEVLSFKTGEVCGPGTLTCIACGTMLHLKRPSSIPSCPTCHMTRFRKSY